MKTFKWDDYYYDFSDEDAITIRDKVEKIRELEQEIRNHQAAIDDLTSKARQTRRPAPVEKPKSKLQERFEKIFKDFK